MLAAAHARAPKCQVERSALFGQAEGCFEQRGDPLSLASRSADCPSLAESHARLGSGSSCDQMMWLVLYNPLPSPVCYGLNYVASPNLV